MSSLHRTAMNNVPSYVAGVPIEDLRRTLREKGVDIVKLNSNENMLGPSPKAVEAVKAEIAQMHLYPDPANRRLGEPLAQQHGVGESQVVVHHGGEEAIACFCHAFVEAGEEVLTVAPTFPFFQIASLIAGAKWITQPITNFEFPVDALINSITPRTKAIYIANPNNPTGTLLSGRDLLRIADAAPHAIIFHDEAYTEYVDDPAYPDAIKLVRENRNMVVMRTFSKAYGLAGMRVGYVVAPERIASVIRNARVTFAANRLGQAAALAALEDKSYLAETLRIVAEGKRQLLWGLAGTGVTVAPSHANFLYIDAGRPCQEVFEELRQEGVIIRPITGNFIRVTVGLPAQNQRFLQAFRHVLGLVTA